MSELHYFIFWHKSSKPLSVILLLLPPNPTQPKRHVPLHTSNLKKLLFCVVTIWTTVPPNGAISALKLLHPFPLFMHQTKIWYFCTVNFPYWYNSLYFMMCVCSLIIGKSTGVFTSGIWYVKEGVNTNAPLTCIP